MAASALHPRGVRKAPPACHAFASVDGARHADISAEARLAACDGRGRLEGVCWRRPVGHPAAQAWGAGHEHAGCLEPPEGLVRDTRCCPGAVEVRPPGDHHVARWLSNARGRGADMRLGSSVLARWWPRGGVGGGGERGHACMWDLES